MHFHNVLVCAARHAERRFRMQWIVKELRVRRRKLPTERRMGDRATAVD
jgi:hypothetical protein